MREVEDFYRGVDVVVVPILKSTGLKIKVAEALASGAPLVAHVHAMEGYPTSEPLHRLPDFKTMARELASLSFDRAPLAKLAAKSHAICAAIERAVDAALETTRARLVAKVSEKLCVVAPMQALDPRSLLHDHLHAAIDYLRRPAEIEIFLIGEAGEPAQKLLREYGLHHHVFVDPDLWESLGRDRARDLDADAAV